jgi:frataxin-like iron-binding protein CyaY
MAKHGNSGHLQIELTKLCRLEVTNKEGSLILEADSESSTMFFTSPLSGSYKYYYDIEQKRFYSNKDGHLLDENLSREAHRYFGDVLDL